MNEPSSSSEGPAPGLRQDGLPPLAPDFVEQDSSEEIDNVIPSRGYEMLPLVGLGGSAGSIGALKTFFSAMPPESGMAFVVILHLSPEFESSLAELLGRTTTMHVMQAEDGQKVLANTVYVIPPGRLLAATDGHLRLTPAQIEPGKRIAVDLFFRSLADTHGPHATAIVLSGADGDGALGIKRIKERGGLTIAQDPEEAEHPSMPRSAIDTGMVDWVLEVARMPDRLIEYRRNEPLLQLPREEGLVPVRSEADQLEEHDQGLREVLGYLRTRTGCDFALYKRATVVRRIARRMQVNNVLTLPIYLDFMRTHAGEPGALLQDLLISVTNFFRDREAFEALEKLIPQLFVGKGVNDVIRVWVPACATGEEAYSIAMLLMEQASCQDAPLLIQIFATDLDAGAIASAREAFYPPSIAADVSEVRLRRFFAKEHGGFRVRRELRECVLFAVHDLLKDAPFSRLDLVSCRNLLIYLTTEAQKRAYCIFHFALRPKGLLFLGSSESVPEESPPFVAREPKHRLYEQVPAPRSGIPVPIGPGTLLRAMEAQARVRGGPVIHGASFDRTVMMSDPDPEVTEPSHCSWEELHFKLIERFAPPSLIVNRDYTIVHVSENAGRFLHFGAGEPSTNLMHVVHPALRVELRAALFRAAQSGTSVEVFRLPMELDGSRIEVDLRVAPAQEIAPDYLLVVFATREGSDREGSLPSEAEPVARHLEREIEQMKVRMRDTVEQYEASTEELRAGNEELQAMNEELRSATEELETSREELQSINEELSTVNQELKGKVDELGRANSDLANLMAATAIATIFLDRALRIMRYTPQVVSLFRLIPGDLGRPLTDLTHRLNYPEMQQDAERVLETLTPIKREVSDGEGRWFLVQMLPYRTTEDRIAGAVLTFVDITESRESELALRESEEQLRFATEAADIYSWVTDLVTLRTQYAANTERVLGFSLPEEREAMSALIHPDDRDLVAREFSRAQRERGRFDVQFRYINPKSGAIVWQMGHGLFVERSDGPRIVGICQNITSRRQAEEEARESQERLRLIVENARDYAIFAMDRERRVTSWNSGAQAILGYTQEEIIGQSGDVIFTEEDRAAGAPEQEAETALAEGRATDERWHLRKDGSRFWGSGVMMSMQVRGEAIGLVKIFRDQTEELRAKEALEKSRSELWDALQQMEHARAEAEAAGRAKDHFLAVLSHELRTPLTPVLMGVRTLARQKDITPEASEVLRMIQRNVQMEAHFIDDLLDLTRISRGKLEIVLEPTDIHEALRHAAEVAASDFEANGQRLSMQMQATAYRTMGDPARLQQVFWNLLKNSSKFAPKESEIRLRTRNEQTAPDGPPRIVVEISDDGIGFEAEDAERIFDAFAQASEAVTREFGGLGLGLAISKATVDAHGGRLYAASKGRHQGATFTVDLQLDPPAETA